MEGRVNTFDKVLLDFESKLAKAEFVAIDTELTGVDIEGEMDTFDESATTRLEKICRVAERYSLIQLGLTLVSRSENGHEGKLICHSYNLFAFPYVCNEIKRDPVFMCQASALNFNARHRVDFNTWIGQGIPYMTREDEKQLKANPAYREDEHDQKIGLLRLWKALCKKKLPFVIHCPLDLFFLLVSFERRPLPRHDPKALAFLIRQCTNKVYDTAHLHGAVGRFRRLGLSKFYEDAKARHEELAKNGSNTGVLPVEFELQGETAVRYSKPAEQMAHEAGYDSLMTAQLFAYLRAISPVVVSQAANRLFLYRSIEFLDIERVAAEGVVGSSMFDLSRVTLLVAALDPSDSMSNEAPRLIATAGAEYKWMDATHILVVLRASGGTAVRKARDLAAQVHGVASWIGFDEWRALQAQQACAVQQNGQHNEVHTCQAGTNGASHRHEGDRGEVPMVREEDQISSTASRTAPCTEPQLSSSTSSAHPGSEACSRERDKERWSIAVRFFSLGGLSGILTLLSLLRLLRRWRRR
jgi:hypothetical protein